MAKLIVAFADYLREERMRCASTIKRYRTVLDEFAAFLMSTPNGDELTIERVDKGHLTEFLRRQSRATPSPSKALWNLRLAALRAFYSYLFREELIEVNPALKIDRIKTRPKEPVPLSLDEYLALVGAMDGSPQRHRARNKAIVHVFYHSALRVAELSSLNLDQVDFENYKLVNVRTKGGKWLSADINDLVVDALERYLPDRAMLARSAAEPALFISKRGTRLSVRTIQDLIKKYGEQAGISRPVTPHLLRHSNATELADMGVELDTIRDICNHASVKTTERYVHARAGARSRAIAALGAQTQKRAQELGLKAAEESVPFVLVKRSGTA